MGQIHRREGSPGTAREEAERVVSLHRQQENDPDLRRPWKQVDEEEDNDDDNGRHGLSFPCDDMVQRRGLSMQSFPTKT